uniref:LAP1_C domain-containing protein n=1 Tax=Mesocestoides corti TaxID=53468 RepID=A0A5K3EY27_MESCO
MAVRKRKPFELGRYLGPVSRDRIRKLEAIKQQLLELDNRLKMEMFGLKELSGGDFDINVSSEESLDIPPIRFIPEALTSVKKRKALFTEPSSPSNVHFTDSSCDDCSSSSAETSSQPDLFTVRISKWPFKKVVSFQPPSLDFTSRLRPFIAFTTLICIGALIYFLCGFQHQQPISEETLRQRVLRLTLTFPNQSDRFWSTVSLALSQQRHLKEPDAPSVLLLIPAALTDDKFHRFLNPFVHALGEIHNKKTCVSIDPYASVQDTLPETLKRSLHTRLQEAYSGGHRCLHVEGIDRLPGEAALVLHGCTDPNSSPFKNAFILLSVAEPPVFRPQSTHREMETFVREHFHSLWDASLGRDEVYALLSRLTGRIGVYSV